MCRHKNEGDERRRGKKIPKKEMDNPSFIQGRHLVPLHYCFIIYNFLKICTKKSGSWKENEVADFLDFLIVAFNRYGKVR